LLREGRTRKWVREVQQVTFNGRYALERGQDVMYVTDRGVFRLTADGMELVEVAPGIGVEQDIVKQIEFPVAVCADLRPMDPRLFRPEPMHWLSEFRSKATARARRPRQQ